MGKNKKSKRYVLCFIVICILICGAIFIYREISNTSIAAYNGGNKIDVNDDIVVNNIKEKEEVDIEEPEKIETINIRAVGDLLMHIDIVAAQYNYENGVYNFDDNFKYIKPYLEEADLTIANLETTLAGEEYGYSGYPCFNTPEQLIDSIKECGVDIISNISNHSLDKGEEGFFNTRKNLKAKSIDIIGTRDSIDDKRYIIKDIKGIKVGIISYSYNTEGIDGGRGLNGIPIPNNVMPLMNTFDPNNLEEDLQEIKVQIDEMRKEGVDSIVFYMHWGEEYQLEPNESQLTIAQFLADEDIDIIFGDHPHTIQPIDIINSNNSNHQTVVVYSLGNFISSQRVESVGNSYTEDGLIVSVDITKNFKTGQVTVGNVDYIPTWVKLNSYNGQNYYTVVPATENNAEYLSDYESERVIQSFNRTVGVVESYSDVAEVFNVQ